MLYLLSIIVSILGGAVAAFGQADYRNFDLGRPFEIETNRPVEIRPLEPQAGVPSYRLKNEGGWKPDIQKISTPSVCFREMQVGNRPKEERWLNRYKNASLCRAKLVQRREFPKQTYGSLAAALLLLFLVGTMGTAALLSTERIEPLKPLIGAVERIK